MVCTPVPAVKLPPEFVVLMLTMQFEGIGSAMTSHTAVEKLEARTVCSGPEEAFILSRVISRVSTAIFDVCGTFNSSSSMFTPTLAFCIFGIETGRGFVEFEEFVLLLSLSTSLAAVALGGDSDSDKTTLDTSIIESLLDDEVLLLCTCTGHWC